MSTEVDLFGKSIVDSGRYGVGTRDGGSPDWPEADDLLLYPVLMGCDSWRAYLDAARRLGSLLDRLPRLEGHPSAAKLADEQVSLLELRTVNRGLGAAGRHHAKGSLARALFTGRNTGRLLTWAEARLARSWAGKKGPCSIERLAALLERGPADAALLTACSTGGGASWPEDPTRPAPCADQEILEFREAPCAETWAALCAACRPEGV